jgi:hypothetical protein
MTTRFSRLELNCAEQNPDADETRREISRLHVQFERPLAGTARRTRRC